MKFKMIPLRVFKTHRQETLLTICAVFVYLVLMFERLAVFPIYFFCDEAVTGVDAYSLLTTGRDLAGEAFPVYFRGLGEYAQSLAVYLQIPATALFGLSEFSVRLTTATISLFGTFCAYALLRKVFAIETAWLVFPIFAFSPLWFIHSRTGFEYVSAASFFLGFGLFYTLAFTRSSWWILPAAMCGAATFFAYNPGRGWILASLGLLLLVNFPEHRRQWKSTLPGIVLFVILLCPYIYFHLKFPEQAMSRFNVLNFAGFQNHSLWQQIRHILENYAHALNPLAWFTISEQPRIIEPGERHIIHGLSTLFAYALPFFVLGLIRMFRLLRSFENRTLLAMLMATPFLPSLVHFNISRGMPVGMLMLMLAVIGVGWCFSWIQRWPMLIRMLRVSIAMAVMIYAIWFRYYMYAVVPYSYQNYGFYGLQMGQSEVFGWIKEHYSEYDNFLLASNLFNATHIFVPFYLHDPAAAQKVRVFDTSLIYKTRDPIPEHAVHIAPTDFFSQMEALHAPIVVTDIATIPDKRGAPLFRIVALERTSEFEAWFQEFQERRRLPERHVIDYQSAQLIVDLPPLDLGSVAAMFDGDRRSFGRTDQINPATITVRIPPAPLRKIRVITPHEQVIVALHTTDAAGQMMNWGNVAITNPARYVRVYEFTAPAPALEVITMTITVRLTDTDQYGHVHIEEIEWE